MMQISKLFVLSFCMLFCSVLTANECIKPKTYIYYINGMNTPTIDIANLQRDKLKEKFQDVFGNDSSLYEFKTSYNPEEITGFQLWQVLKQRAASDSSYGASLAERARSYSDSTLSKFVGEYLSVLREGHRLILVGHSQGSMYANNAYSQLIQKNPDYADKVGVLLFGTPDNIITAENGYHVSLKSDWVVNLVRVYYGRTLSNLTENKTRKGHGFYTYIEGEESFKKLRLFMSTIEGNLRFPDMESRAGTITVELTWNQRNDVDLHVTEPSGSHVYYAQNLGDSGVLDRDSRIGEFPEHYYVHCLNLEEGDYKIGVNYFSGDELTQVRAVVKAGEALTRTVQKNLQESKGPFGDNSPIPFATISVDEESESGKYLFKITTH